MKVSDTLLEAASYIRQYGWCQNRLGDQGAHQPVCLVEAIGVRGYSLDYPQCCRYTRTAISEVYGTSVREYEWPPGSGIVGWNNTEGRTAEQVIHVLEYASKLALADGL